MILLGFPQWIAVINLPQRFQLVYNEDPIYAGVHLMPLLVSIAFGKNSALPVELLSLTNIYR
jgi:hypothetical protein